MNPMNFNQYRFLSFFSFFLLGTVRIFGAESKVSNQYHDNLLKSYTVGKKLALSNGWFMGVVGILTAGGISVVLW